MVVVCRNECGTPSMGSDLCEATGSPAHLRSGNFFQMFPDIATRGETPIELSRVYNSQDRNEGPFGQGTIHPYALQAIRVKDGDTPIVIIRYQNGIRLRFTRQPDGSYASCACNRMTLVGLPDEELELRSADLTRHVFDARGFLREVRSETGGVWTVGTDPDGKVTRIDSSSGQSIMLAYNAASKVESIRSDGGDHASYTYDSGRRLEATVDPGGDRTTYAHDEAGRLKEMRDSEGRLIFTVGYDGRGRLVYLESGATPTEFIYDDSRLAVTERTRVTKDFSDCPGDTIDTRFGLSPLGRILSKSVGGSVVEQRIEAPETGDASQISDGLKRTIDVEYHRESGLPTKVTGPDGVVYVKATLATPAGRPAVVETVQLASGEIIKLEYDHRWRLIGMVNPLEERVSYAYDDLDRVVRIVQPTGRFTSFEYNSAGLPNRIEYGMEDPSSRFLSTFATPGPGDLRPVNPGRAIYTIHYDQAQNPTHWIDPLGHITETRYGSRGLPVMTIDALGGIVKMDHGWHGQVEKIHRQRRYGVDEFSTTTFGYSLPVIRMRGDNGPARRPRLVSVQNALGQSTSIRYHKDDLVGRVTNHRGEYTTSRYDCQDRRTTFIDAKFQTRKFIYNAASELTSEQNPLGRKTTYGYDGIGRLVETIHPDLSRIALAYHLTNEIASITDEEDRTTRFEIDGAGRTTAIVDPLGHPEKLTYDKDGRVLTRSDRLGHTVTYGYSPLGHLESVKLPNGTTYRFVLDPLGRVLELITPGGGHWKFAYDALGRVIGETDPKGAERAFEYDPSGNVIKLTEPSADGPLVTEIAYDPIDRPTKLVSPDQQIDVVYLEKIPYSSVSPNGRRAVETTIRRTGEPVIALREELDQLDRLVRERTTKDGAVQSDFKYWYDGNSNLTEMWNVTTRLYFYKYDLRDRLIEVKDVRTGEVYGFEYNRASELTRVKYPGGASKSILYGPRGEIALIDFKDPFGTLLRSLAYQYDANLQVTSIDDTLLGTTAYTYDKLGRLETATYPGGLTESFLYDGNGNVLSVTRGRTTEEFSYDLADEVLAKQILEDGIAGNLFTVTSDERGNVTKIRLSANGGKIPLGERVFRWDAQGRLVEVTRNELLALRASYLDDYRLDREDTPTNGPLTNLWSFGNVLYERDGLSGSEQIDYITIFGLDNHLARGPPGPGKDLVLTDHVGTVLAETDPQGTPKQSYEYFAFGGHRAGDVPVKVGFHGARLYEEAGLYYFRKRWYSPELGRFISRDPIGFLGGANLYEHVRGNAVSLRDNTGENPLVLGGAVGAGLGAAFFAGRAAYQGGTRQEVGKSALEGAAVGAAVGVAVPLIGPALGAVGAGAVVRSSGFFGLAAITGPGGPTQTCSRYAQIVEAAVFHNGIEFTRRIANMIVMGNFRVPNPSTYVVNIGVLQKAGGTTADYLKLFARLRMEALTAGASRLVVNAHNVLETSPLLRPERFNQVQRLGFRVHRVSPDSYQLILDL